MIRAKLYAIGAAVVAAFLAAFKIVLMQRNAAREDLRRAKKHIEERNKIVRAEKAIKRDTREAKTQAVKDIKDGKIPANIRDRNSF